MPCAANFASASASGTKALVCGSSSVAADTLHAAGNAAGPAVAARLQALVELRAERVDDDGVALGAGGEHLVLVDEKSGLRFCREGRRRISLRRPGLDARGLPPSICRGRRRAPRRSRSRAIAASTRTASPTSACRWSRARPGCPRRYAVTAERGLELRDRRHHEAQLGVWIGELALQIQKIRAGNMPGLERVPSGHGDIGNACCLRAQVRDRSCNRTAADRAGRGYRRVPRW